MQFDPRRVTHDAGPSSQIKRRDAASSDQALYSAKNRGRNRTEVAVKSTAEARVEAAAKSIQAA